MPSLQTHLDRPPSAASAPLPSPTLPQQSFASFHPSHTQQSHTQQNQAYLAPPPQQPSQPQRQLQQQQQQQQQGGVQNACEGQRGGRGGPPETSPFLQDFTLVAEAAKRAQMACLMRDLEGCEL